MEPKRILIVDDEAAFSNLVKANLDRTGRYQACVENRPMMAVTTALQFKPALILLDVVMPEMDGGQLLAELRLNEQLKETPVILLTATVTQQVAKVLQGQVRCQAILAKPIDPKRLIQKLDEVLEMTFFSFRFGRTAGPQAATSPA